MATVLLVIHLMIAAGLVGVVLLQRSEGGALGIGGGGGGFMTGRGAANLLTRATAVLAGLFFLTSIGLTLLAMRGGQTGSPLDLSPPAKQQPATPDTAPADAGKGTPGGVLDSLQKGRQPLGPQVPKSQ